MIERDSQIGSNGGGLNRNGGSSSSSSSSQVYISHKNNTRKRFSRWFIPLSLTDIKNRHVHMLQVVVLVPLVDRIVLGVGDCPSIMVWMISKHNNCQKRLGSSHGIAYNQSRITITKSTWNVKVQNFSAYCPFIAFQVCAMICTIICNWQKAVAAMANTYLGQTGSIDGLPGRSNKVGNMTSASRVYECPDSQ